MAKRPTFYILDAFSLIYQVFHAIPLMTSPKGEPVHAVFGVFRDVLNLIKKQPEAIAVAFEGIGPVFRDELFSEYKANRAAMPEELRSQIPVIARLYQAFGIPVVSRDGFEADDVIATLARQAEQRGMDVFVCTADKDARQLISDHIAIFNVRKQQVYDAAALQADWGIRPDQVVDLLALAGDPVDNVPGVPGIGVKTASTLLQQFDNIDQLLANIPKVAGAAKQKNLTEHGERTKLGRELVRLRDDVPIEFDWDLVHYNGYDYKALRDLCHECGFHRFLQELVDDQPEANPWTADYQTIDSRERFQEFVAQLKGQERFSVDTETTGLNPLRSELVGLSFAWNPGQGYYLPILGPPGAKTLPLDRVVEALGPILNNPAVEKIGQNLKFDIHVLQRAGLPLAGPLTDTMILSYLLESGERNHNLDELAQRFLGHAMMPISELIGTGKKQITMDQVPVAKVSYYAAEDADAAWRLEALLGSKVKEDGLWDLYTSLERPLIEVLARMEQAGVAVDAGKLQGLARDFGEQLDRIERRIHELSDREFNINSVPQLRQVLFEDLKLPVLAKTPGGEPSTAQEVLEELAGLHELPRLLLQHRQLSKLKGTYLDALPLMIDPRDGRIHATFNQVVAATGRLSSSDPNLQHIPIRSEEGKQIRQAFMAGKADQVLLTADYSQIELRVLAHFSEDPALREAFENDRDIHSAVAAKIFNVPLEQVDSSQRRAAKTVNFGVLYGLSPYGLSARLGITQTEAAAFIDAYFREYAGVDAFITRTLENALRLGYVETIRQRRRAINGIKTTTGRNRNPSERAAVNTVIQGSAADLIKQAMITLDQRLRAENFQSRMILQIHDELVFEGPMQEITRLAPLVNQVMTEAIELKVPLKVDIAIGPNWLDVEPWSPGTP